MNIRRIVVFHNTAHVGSAWCCAEGISSVLREMGYVVTDGGNPSLTGLPEQQLVDADFIILGAPEWFAAALQDRYGSLWGSLRAPKAAWYAESFERDDRSFDFAPMMNLADRHYFPAIQDAKAFGGAWLPFGVDLTVFRPMETPQRYDAAFLGSLYPKRLDFIRRVDYPLARMVSVEGSTARQSFEMLAEAYCSTKIFVNLPAYSRLVVTKVTEVMACGTMLITPRLDHPSASGNMHPFKDRKHLVYYDPDAPTQIGSLVGYYLGHPAERQRIARAGRREVVRRHSLRQRLSGMIRDAEEGGPATGMRPVSSLFDRLGKVLSRI
jgi:hypothetical protein